MKNLDIYASSCLSTAIYGATDFDLEEISEKARDAVCEEAEGACTYTGDCQEIISRYESDYANQIEDVGGSFTAEQWREAMTAYAQSIARAVIGTLVETALGELQERADALTEASGNDALQVARDCPFGWFPHASETERGVCFWPNIEGSGPRWAIDAGGFWLWAEAPVVAACEETI